MSDDPRWDDDPRDRRDDNVRERDDGNAPHVGRGPGSAGQRDEQSDENSRSREDNSRGIDRASRQRDKGLDPRDVFMRDLDLPRGHDREIVHDARNREYNLRGSESRTLSTVGAFRVVLARALGDHNTRPADP